MELFVFLVTCILFLWCFYLWNIRIYLKLAFQIPSNKWQRLFCCGKFVRAKDFIQTTYAYSVKYGANSLIWLGPVPFFLSSDPQVLKEIFSSKNCLAKPGIIYDSVNEVVGAGLFSTNGSTWSGHRKIVNRAFSNKILGSFLPIFNKNIDSAVEEIGNKVDNGETIDLIRMFKIFTLKNASETHLKRNIDLAGYDAAELATILEQAMDHTTDMVANYTMRISVVRKLANIFMDQKIKKVFKEFKDFVRDSLQKYEEMEKNNSTADPSVVPELNSLVDYLYSGSKETTLNKDEIITEVIHVIAGAFETTSTSLFLVLVLLAMYPEYQERAFEEVSGIVPDDDTVMTIEQIDQLSYLEMVFKETIRLFPIASSTFRQVSGGNVYLSNGWILPAGLRICIDFYSLHRNKDVWGSDANVFNPDNFLPCKTATRHPFSFAPFSKGQRMCVGYKYAEILNKITLAKIIKRYKFSTDFKYENLIAMHGVSVRLPNKPQLYIERREK